MTTFEEYQKFVNETATYPRRGSNPYPLYGLVSEVGELFGKLKRPLRGETPPPNKDELYELGDILWYLTESAHYRGFSLEQVAQANVAKLRDRHARGVQYGTGDNR